MTLLSRNDRVWGTTQHSQVESSQVEKISLQAFLSRRERLGEGATFNSATVKQLQEPNNKTELRSVKQKRAAFTLAEVLITLGIIGVVAALTLPALLTNIQSKVRAERSRSVQYKFSLATEKMARLNLIGPYDSTDAFVD